MTTKTISQVNEEPRNWTSDDNKISLAFITVTFDDGDQGSVACKPDNAENVIGILNGLKGKESDFQLEAKDDYNGIKQFKIKNYPGKPGQDFQRSSGGGGGGGQRRHDPETNASIEAQVAAKIAGEIVSSAVRFAGLQAVPDADPVGYVTKSIPRIAAMIRQVASGRSENTPESPQESGSASPPSGGPLPSPGPDEAEGDEQGVTGAPAPSTPDASPDASTDLGWGTGPMTPQQKAKLNMLYQSAGKAMISAKAMFPEVTKIADLTETQAAALIEDKE